jgi:hypothetical protein
MPHIEPDDDAALRQQIATIKALMFDLTPEQQTAIRSAKDRIRAVVDEAEKVESGIGSLALAWAGAEFGLEQ